MAEKLTDKYLSYEGLKTYTEQLKKYYAENSLEGVVGFADKAGKLNTPRKIEFIGGVEGDGYFDGSSDVTINTTLNISGTLDADITGNAATASNFKINKPIDLVGDITGHGVGGEDASGWNISTTLANGSVTNAKLAGGITNDKLVNKSITIGTSEVQLGGTLDTLEGLQVVTSDAFIGNLAGIATNANRATADAQGNVIVTTYATKAELAQISSAIRFKGSVPTFADLPENPQNGDIYNVEDEGKTYIWSSDDNAWSIFGSSYGPATADTFGLVKTGANITNENGKISISGDNVDDALGYEALKAVRVNNELIPVLDRTVNISVPTDYATQADIDASINHTNIIDAIGYEPLENVAVNGTDLEVINHRVNVDLTDYTTEEVVDEKIRRKLSSLYIFKGSLATYGDLLAIEDPVVGDTYNIIKGNDPDVDEPDWPAFAAGTNFAWDGDEWDSLGGTLDLSNYYKKSETNALLNEKADKNHIHDDRYYRKSEVDALLANLKSWVLQEIINERENNMEYGAMDDIREFATMSAFPAKGVTGVQYIAIDTGLEYMWAVDDETLGTGHYFPINETTTKADIEDLFK